MPEEKKKPAMIIRLAETDLDGTKPVGVAIRGVKGVGFMFSNAITKTSGFGDKKIGDLADSEQKKLEDIILNPEKYDIPAWLYNRKGDPATGKDRHLTVSQLELTKKLDIDRLKKIRCYRGVRHGLGLPVRGQRTRGSFRKGRAVGVRRKAARMREAAAKPKKEKK